MKILYMVLAAWVLAGLLMYCHRHDIEQMRNAFQAMQRLPEDLGGR